MLEKMYPTLSKYHRSLTHDSNQPRRMGSVEKYTTMEVALFSTEEHIYEQNLDGWLEYSTTNRVTRGTSSVFHWSNEHTDNLPTDSVRCTVNINSL